MGWSVSGWTCRSKLDRKGFCTVGGAGMGRCAFLAPAFRVRMAVGHGPGGVALAQPLAKFLHRLRMPLAGRRSASHPNGSPGGSPHQRGPAVRELTGEKSGTDALRVSPFRAAEHRTPYRGGSRHVND